ncbi:hypothetical protein D3C87_1126630 [compost metagenome]
MNFTDCLPSPETWISEDSVLKNKSLVEMFCPAALNWKPNLLSSPSKSIKGFPLKFFSPFNSTDFTLPPFVLILAMIASFSRVMIFSVPNFDAPKGFFSSAESAITAVCAVFAFAIESLVTGSPFAVWAFASCRTCSCLISDSEGFIR